MAYYAKTWPTIGLADIYKQKSGFVQNPPYVSPLGYTAKYSTCTSRNGDSTLALTANDNFHTLFPTVKASKEAEAYNKAYSKFKDKVSDRAQWASNVIEARKSMSMITTRCLQIYHFARKLKKGRVEEALAVLGQGLLQTDKKKQLKGRVRESFANTFLELHFGWSPLIGDIGNSVNFLQEPIKSPIVFGRGTSVMSQHNYLVGAYSKNHYYGREARCEIGSKISVANPNLWLANSMGFTNPMSVAWEVVPFSFVVDWFINVGDFLSSYNEFAGLNLVDGYTTRSFYGTSRYYWNNYGWTSAFSVREHSRVVGTAGSPVGPSLAFKPLKLPSPMRALTAVSLVIQQLSKR